MDIKRPKRRPQPQVAKPAAKAPAKPGAATRPQAARKPARKPVGKQPDITDDISMSLKSIDDEPKSAKKRKGRRANKKPWTKKRKIVTIVLIILALLLLVGGYFAFRLANSGGKMFSGNILDALLSNDKLAQDEQGRTNILIFGTSEDDPGHSGALLTDSIMMLSINQETKKASTVNIPRDMWVSYDTTCSVGNQGKINATYYCTLEQNGNDEEAASIAFAKKAGEVLGLETQYYAKINYSFVRDSVNALGGVDVKIDSRDPRGLYDNVTGLNLQNGINSIDGEQALDLTRARGSKGGYGFEQSNFDREKNQQAVMRAIQDKAVSSGTLANPLKALDLVDSLSNNIVTNVKSSELKTVIGVASGVKSDEIKSISLNSPQMRLVTTGSHNGQSIVRPIKGLMDYSDIHAYLREQLPKKETTN